VAKAIEAAAKKPPVIWLEGQDCAGCSISFLSSEQPSAAELILDTLSLRYHEAVMAAAGHKAEHAMAETIKEGGYVLVVEGSIPATEDRFCMVGGRPFREILLECAAGAAAIVAVGSCAAFGGIPGDTVSQGKGVAHFVKDKPVINLPMCPVHPEHMVETIVYFLQNKAAPPLDKHGRPELFFSKTVHDLCERKKHFDNDEYLTDWNDPKQKDWCLGEKGCKGSDTYSDCPTRMYNGKLSYCIDAGCPCMGCAEPTFYAGNSPLYAGNADWLEVRKGGKA